MWVKNFYIIIFSEGIIITTFVGFFLKEYIDR